MPVDGVFEWFLSIVAFNANAFVLILHRSRFGGDANLGLFGTIYVIAHCGLELLWILVFWILMGDVYSSGQSQLGAAIAFSVFTFLANIAVAVFFFTGIGSDRS